MVDINAQAQAALEKTGYNVVFRYPQNMGEIPVIAFYTVSESGELSADNCEMFRRGVIGADVFGTTPMECMLMSQSAETAMKADGWDMIEAADADSEADGVFCRKMKFTKSFYVFEEGGII